MCVCVCVCVRACVCVNGWVCLARACAYKYYGCGKIEIAAHTPLEQVVYIGAAAASRLLDCRKEQRSCRLELPFSVSTVILTLGSDERHFGLRAVYYRGPVRTRRDETRRTRCFS